MERNGTLVANGVDEERPALAGGAAEAGNPSAAPAAAGRVWALTVLALVLGLVVAPHEAFYTDFVYFWFPWSHATGGLRPWEMYTHTFPTEHLKLASCNYLPLVPYLLTFSEAVRLLLRLPADGDANLVLIKAPFLLAWAACGPLCYYDLRRRYGERQAQTAAVLCLLAAPMFVDAALWGQADTVLALALLAALVALLNDRPTIAGLLFGVALATKLQALAALPVMAVYIGRRHGLRSVAVATLAGIGAFVVLALPVVIGGGLDGFLRAIGGSVGYYPLRAVTAHNGWFLLDTYDIWLCHRPGSVRIDTNPLLGPLTARQFGYVTYALYLALILRRLWRRLDPPTLAFALAMSELAFYMLPTEMHERYILPAILFAAVFAPALRSLRALYTALFVLIAADEYLVLVWVNGLVLHHQTAFARFLYGYGGVACALAYCVFFVWATVLYIQHTRSAPSEAGGSV